MATEGQDEGPGSGWPVDPQPQPSDDASAAFALPPQQPIVSPSPDQTPSWSPAPAGPPPAQPVAPGYPPTPGLPPAPWLNAAPGQPPVQGYPPAPGYPPVQGYPPAPGYPSAPAYMPGMWPQQPPAPGFASQPGYPPVPGSMPGYWPPPAGFGYAAPAWPSAPIQFGPAPGLVWGGIAPRFGALVLDAVVMFVTLIVASIVASAFGIHYYHDGIYEQTVYSTGASATYLVWFIFFLGYHPTCWWAFQGTLGQRALGLRVVRESDGGSLGVGMTTIRYLLWAVCQVVVIPAIIAAAMANDNPRKQTWWDDAAGSVVVRRA